MELPPYFSYETFFPIFNNFIPVNEVRSKTYRIPSSTFIFQGCFLTHHRNHLLSSWNSFPSRKIVGLFLERKLQPLKFVIIYSSRFCALSIAGLWTHLSMLIEKKKRRVWSNVSKRGKSPWDTHPRRVSRHRDFSARLTRNFRVIVLAACDLTAWLFITRLSVSVARA